MTSPADATPSTHTTPSAGATPSLGAAPSVGAAQGDSPVAPGQPGVAAFDFDGTLIGGDSLLPFLSRLVGFKQLAVVGARRLPSLLAGYRRGGRDETKAVLFRDTLAGIPLARAQDLGERYGVELLRQVRPEMSQAIARHRTQGHRLILVSASLALYLEPFGQSAGFDDVIATRLEVSPDGRLTGRLQGANVRGPEKARLLLAAVGPAPMELWVYGDSAGDRQMLAIADHPHLVGHRLRRSTPGLHPRPTLQPPPAATGNSGE